MKLDASARKLMAALNRRVVWISAALIASFAVGYVVIGIPEFRRFVWSSRTLDVVVIATIIMVFVLLTWFWIKYRTAPNDGARKQLRESLTAVGGFLLLVSGLYVSYASFRNQTRLAAEASLNSEVVALYAIEMDSKEIRCLYYNYGHNDPQTCLNLLTRDHEEWSRAIFYVEEAWYALERAQYEHIEWGSSYADGIAFWIEDLERDPTGIFSYYLVATEETLSEAYSKMEGAGVAIPDLCVNHNRVWLALGANRPPSSQLTGAARECIGRIPRRSGS